jgi:hypothetical protein
MRMGRTKQLVTAALVSGALLLVGAAGPALAEEPEPPAEAPPVTTPIDEVPVDDVPVADPPGSAVGEVDGVPVAVAEALVPPAAQVASVAVQAERSATAVVDGVEVGVGEAPVPPASTTEQVPVAPVASEPVTVPAPAHVPGPAVAEVPTVALVLAAWG